MVESGGLENRCALIRTEGSNPSLSAGKSDPHKMRVAFFICEGFEPKQRVRLMPTGMRTANAVSPPPKGVRCEAANQSLPLRTK